MRLQIHNWAWLMTIILGLFVIADFSTYGGGVRLRPQGVGPEAAT